MDYRPNIDAVLWFADEVLPLILHERPEVRFQIVGMNPHPRLDRLRQQSAIEITGAVESIEPYMQSAAVYVVPLRVGGGTRFKVLDAMMYAKPMVSTSLGVEGIGVQHEGELLVADTPPIFAQAVLRLLYDSMLGNRLGANAHQFVSCEYSWQKIMPHLEAVYQRLLATTTRTA